MQVANVYLGIPVRVFRKFEEPSGAEYECHYVYDGLYYVVRPAFARPCLVAQLAGRVKLQHWL